MSQTYQAPLIMMFLSISDCEELFSSLSVSIFLQISAIKVKDTFLVIPSKSRETLWDGDWGVKNI
jgi:hypothetical protein